MLGVLPSPRSTALQEIIIYPSVTIVNGGDSTATGPFLLVSIYSDAPNTVAGSGTPSDVRVWAYEPGSIAPGASKTYSITTNSALVAQ